MNRRIAPFVPKDLTARRHARSNIGPLTLGFGTAPAVGLSAVQRDKEQPSCRLQ